MGGSSFHSNAWTLNPVAKELNELWFAREWAQRRNLNFECSSFNFLVLTERGVAMLGHGALIVP